jgi:pilus assembly protein FimV
LFLLPALTLTLLPVAAWALGLGGINTRSGLSQPFLGEIDLYEVGIDELDTVKVSLASEADFEKTGTARSPFLSRLRFQPTVSRQGRTIIQITSTEPVREPFLDFLIAVTWPEGRLVKEYTVLLDPPENVRRTAPGGERPKVSRSPSPETRGGASRTRPPQRTSSSHPVFEGYPIRYGPVESGAALLRIARIMAPPDATVAQTATAIYRTNQDAFVAGDINKLKLGALLEIPTGEELFALDAQAAEKEFRQLLAGGTATTTPLTESTRSEPPTGRLSIATADAPAGSAGEPEGPVGSPGPANAEAGVDAAKQTGLRELQRDLLLVQEAGESTRQETRELRARVRELGDQLTDIRTFVELTNEQLARIQTAQREPDGARPSEPIRRSSPSQTDERVAAVEDGPETAAESTGGPDGSAADPTGRERAVTAEAEETGAAPQGGPSRAASPNEASFWRTLPFSSVAGAVGLPLILLLMAGLVIYRRKRLEESLADRPTPETAAVSEEKTLSGTSGMLSEQYLAATEDHLDSPAPTTSYSAFSAISPETDDADVLAEADVYIAYGRYGEAETLLTDELAVSPQRLDLQFKLAEVHYSAKQAEAFHQVVTEMRTQGAEQADPQRWQRLMSMAQELSTDEPVVEEWIEEIAPDLRSPEPEGSPGPAGAREPTPEESLELDIDLDELGILDSAFALEEEASPPRGAVSELELNLDASNGEDDLDLTRRIGARRPTGKASRQTERPEDEILPVFADEGIGAQDIHDAGEDGPDSHGAGARWEMDAGLWDEVATKIDLARAYKEMQDLEAARVILEEVIAEGSEEQRAEARGLLAQLD